LINVNWWCQFRDHPNGLVAPPSNGIITDMQLERASGIISSLLDFKALLVSNQIPAEYMRDAPLCMNQYKNQFGVSRVPGNGADTIRNEYPPKASHIVVLCRDQIYKLDVEPNGNRIAIKEIQR
jgi:hypothetical protein